MSFFLSQDLNLTDRKYNLTSSGITVSSDASGSISRKESAFYFFFVLPLSDASAVGCPSHGAGAAVPSTSAALKDLIPAEILNNL